MCTIACNFIATHMEMEMEISPAFSCIFVSEWIVVTNFIACYEFQQTSSLSTIAGSILAKNTFNVADSVGLGLAVWLVLVCWLIDWFTGIGWLVGWFWFVCWLNAWCWLVGWLVGFWERSLCPRPSIKSSLTLSLSLSQSPFYKYQFNDVNVLAEICKQ